MRRLIFLVVILFVTSAEDVAAEIAGRATVIDGDTIEIRGQRNRLYGIDSPESAQLIGFRSADLIADKLGIEKTAMIRARAGVGYALAEAMDDGHCGLRASSC